jgi:DNA gyrase subunit B
VGDRRQQRGRGHQRLRHAPRSDPAQGSQIGHGDDNGRGIPVDIKKEFKKSALELVLTVLHAGGKFSSGQYQYSGGLHGVGSSVVNALSEEMVARVKRDGHEWEQRYARGEVASKLTKIATARGTGTSIFFRPDPQIFGKLDFSAETIRFRLETKTFLHKGLKITFRDEAAGTSEVLQHDGGIADFLTKIVADRGKAPTTPQMFYFSAKTKTACASKRPCSGPSRTRKPCAPT